MRSMRRAMMKRTIAAALAGFGIALLLGVPAPVGTPARGELRTAASGKACAAGRVWLLLACVKLGRLSRCRS